MIKRIINSFIYSLAISLINYSLLLDLFLKKNIFLINNNGNDFLGWIFIFIYAFIFVMFYINYNKITKYVFKISFLKYFSFILTLLIIFIYTESGVIFKLLWIRNSENYKKIRHEKIYRQKSFLK